MNNTSPSDESGYEKVTEGLRKLSERTVPTPFIDRTAEALDSEVRSVSSTGAEKGVKIERFDLIPVEALSQVARHYGVGAQKYAEHNWRYGYEWSKSYSALQRHLTAFWSGVDIDEETQSPHLAAAAFHIFAMMTFAQEHPEFDDRPIPARFQKPRDIEKGVDNE